MVGHVELHRVGGRPDLAGGGLAALEVARADQHGEAVGREVLGDLQADPLVGAGDEGDGRVGHVGLRCCGWLKAPRGSARTTGGSMFRINTDH